MRMPLDRLKQTLLYGRDEYCSLPGILMPEETKATVQIAIENELGWCTNHAIAEPRKTLDPSKVVGGKPEFVSPSSKQLVVAGRR